MNIDSKKEALKKKLYAKKVNRIEKKFNNEEYDIVIDILINKRSQLTSVELQLLAEAYYFSGEHRKANDIFEQCEDIKLHQNYLKNLSKIHNYHKAAQLWNDTYLKSKNLEKKLSTEELIEATIVNYRDGNEKYKHYIDILGTINVQNEIWNSFANEEAWELAIYSAKAYLNSLDGIDVKLYYKISKWYIHMFEYQKAKEYLTAYLQVEKPVNAIILLSIVEERLEFIDNAIRLLESINIFDHSNKVNLGYRLASLYMKKKQYEKAAAIFYKYRYSNKITNEVILFDKDFILGEEEKSLGNYDEALKHYLKVLCTYRGHFSPLYGLIGELYYLKKEYKISCSYFKQYNVSDKFYGFDSKVMPKLSRVSYYVEQYESLPIESNSILYCAYNGDVFSGNLLAMYNYYKNNKELKHFIALKDIKQAPSKLLDKDNIFLIQYESRLHYKLLASAKYIFTNGTYLFEYIRKENQVALNTWHGTPMKRLGFDITSSSYSKSRNIINSYYTSTHIIHPNKPTQKQIMNSFALKNEKIHQVTGYPRQDLLTNIKKEKQNKLKNILGLDVNKTTILYAPTVRDKINKKCNQSANLQHVAIKKMKNNSNYNFIYKGHYSEAGNNPVDTIDTNELLSIVDILITDYSSLAIDFLVTNKPFILFTYDIEEYKNLRGLYFEPSSITDNVVETLDQLIKLLDRIMCDNPIDKKAIEARKLYCSYDDGNATSRVMKILNTETISCSGKEKLLLFAGNIFLTNGITISFLNLIENIDFKKYEVYILLTKSSFKKNNDEAVLDGLRKKGCSLLFYYGAISASRIERYAYTEFNKNMYFYNEYHKRLYIAAMERTAKRIFGNLTFTKIFNFESGYTRDVSIMLSLMKADKKYLVLHSDMEEERKLRFPHLANTFHFWDYYDQLLSVSDVISNLNYCNIGKKFNIIREDTSVLANFLDIKKIENYKKEVINKKEEKLFKFDKTFISIGRLSVEKNHMLLVESFAIAKNNTKENINLVIIGEGILYEKLQKKIIELGMKKYITIIKFTDNPYKYLERAHCLISSSLQEGQGLVLLEALVMNKQILATNIPASTEIVEKYGGVLCNLTKDDMSRKIIDISNKSNFSNNFDAIEYNDSIKKRLNRLL